MKKIIPKRQWEKLRDEDFIVINGAWRSLADENLIKYKQAVMATNTDAGKKVIGVVQITPEGRRYLESYRDASRTRIIALVGAITGILGLAVSVIQAIVGK